jgi:Family of unknown function (DUF6335)
MAKKRPAKKAALKRVARKRVARASKRRAPRKVVARKVAAKRKRAAVKKAVRKVAVKRAVRAARKRAVKRAVAKRMVATKIASAPPTKATRPAVGAPLESPSSSSTPMAPEPTESESGSASDESPEEGPRRRRSRARSPSRSNPDRASIPSSLGLARAPSSARSGRQELRDQLERHTETSPAITAGDVDANWEGAYSSGDEAPGGDNPTPDQDVVDDIGRALGVEYEADEELKGADKLSERDKHRWELDPASSEDFRDRD